MIQSIKFQQWQDNTQLLVVKRYYGDVIYWLEKILGGKTNFGGGGGGAGEEIFVGTKMIYVNRIVKKTKKNIPEFFSPGCTLVMANIQN